LIADIYILNTQKLLLYKSVTIDVNSCNKTHINQIQCPNCETVLEFKYNTGVVLGKVPNQSFNKLKILTKVHISA